MRPAPAITTTSTSATALRQDENQTPRLYTYRATDPEGGTVTWSVGGDDGRFFAIDDRGQFSFSASTPPNFEQPRDLDGNNVYEVEIQAGDGVNRDSLAVRVTVREVNEGPAVTGEQSLSFTENQTTERILATYTATDPEDPSASITRWSLSGSDAGDFTITESGDLSFRQVPDYDRPADSGRDNVYNFSVRASDGRKYGYLPVTVTVTDVNEANPEVSGRDSLTVSENFDRTLHTYRARDMDLGTTFTWSVRGADSGEFAISDGGALTFSSTPDFEHPADAGSDNVYEITVVASDGATEGSLAVSITVTDVNEGPEITGQDSRTVSENFDDVLATYTATDPEDATAEITRWSVTGRDGGDFSITAAGELTFRNPPDVERPADSNRDNEYEVTVRASDGRVTGTLDVTVVVEDVNEAPDFRSGSKTSFTYRENGAFALYTYRATDPEQGQITWSLRGADAGDFLIGATGILTFASPPDFDTPAGSGVDGNDYLVTVVVTDDGTYGTEGQLTGSPLASTLEVTITVTDVNEGPEIAETSANTAITVRENHDQVLATYSATDPDDPAAAITRWSVTGRDGGDFSINEAGKLTFRNPPDFERPADSGRDNTYEVTVRASDGRYDGTLDVTVTVAAVDEAPEFQHGSKDAFTYAENGTAAITTYRATDPEGSGVTWGLAGTDPSAFTMSETGVLAFNSPPDYESPTDADGNNVYEVTVEARDDNGNPTSLAVTVTVTNVTDVGTPSNVQVTQHGSGQLRVSWKAPDAGTRPDGYTVQWKKSEADWADDEDVSEAPVTDTSHIIKGLTDGEDYAVRVIAAKDATESAPSKEATATPQETTPPTPASATVDGATLTLAFNEALDSGKAPGKSAFAVAVDGSSRGVDAVGVSGSVVTITLVTAVFAGDAVTVDYTAPTDESVARLQDLAGNAAASVSGRKVSNTTHAADQMTATISAAPEAHDGDFTFEVRFSEAPHDGFSDTTMRDHAFSVTGGAVTQARQLAPPSNLGWEIHVTPNGDGAVAIVLPVTTDCTAKGAICTADRRPLSNRLEVTVPGPPSQQASQGNSPATGAPTISGTAQVGEALTAETSGIADADGLGNVSFTYEWIADDSAIAGATAATYTLAAADERKAIKVRVSFTDDTGHAETVTSAATGAVAAAGVQPKSATVDGSALTLTYEGNLDEGVTLPSSAFTVTVGGNDRAVNRVSVSGKTVNLTLASAVAAGETVKVGYAKPDGPDFIRDTLGREGDSFSDHAVTNNTPEALPQQQEAVNTPATGAPTISGTAQVGEALTAETSGIADADGLGNVSFTYEWIADDSAIAGATAATYTLAAADERKAIKVRVSFTDDTGHAETVTSAATGAVAAAGVQPKSATVDGSALTLTYEGNLDEGVTLPSSAFTVTVGGNDRAVNRVSVSGKTVNLTLASAVAAGETVKVGYAKPDGPDFIRDTLGREGDSFSDHAVTNNTPEALPQQQEAVNTPATGAPTISGTAQVGETLTANTSGIADADGLDNVTFTYQWRADDTTIQGATNATYTLVEADEGKSIKVQVRFTDNAGHDETLTSTATAAVTPAPTPNNPATGAPAITGTAQVGETLTANTSGISDADGLENVSFSYQWLADDAAIAGATGSTYTLADSDEGKTVRVQASFTDNEGNEETLTSAATAAVAGAQPTEPPAKPKGLSATASHDSVTLTWNDPGDDSITGYVILRRVRENDVGGEFSELVPDTGSTATTYTDDMVAAGITYTYRIKAINEHGVSERSRWFHIDTPAAPVPDQPTGLEATASHDSVTLTWDDPGDDSITGYVILRRVRVNDTGGDFDVLSRTRAAPRPATPTTRWRPTLPTPTA